MTENIKNEIVPDYYFSFMCIADKCRHNCCVGWEIDIDEKTLDLYKNTDGLLGEELKKNISFESETSYFILDENERCPFLLKNNLCKIISQKGEHYLCNICRDHPRFKNFYENVVEIGLGLSCEEACRIILSKKDGMKLLCDEKTMKCFNEDEKEFFNLRNKIFKILDSDELSFFEKTQKIFSDNSVKINKISFEFWCDFFLTLEIFDKMWIEKLNEARKADFKDVIDFIDENNRIFSNMTAYFVFRHLQKSLFDFSFCERLAFCFLCSFLVSVVCVFEKQKKTEFFECDIFEIARMYSNEIEYSEENTELVIDKLNELLF